MCTHAHREREIGVYWYTHTHAHKHFCTNTLTRCERGTQGSIVKNSCEPLNPKPETQKKGRGRGAPRAAGRGRGGGLPAQSSFQVERNVLTLPVRTRRGPSRAASVRAPRSPRSPRRRAGTTSPWSSNDDPPPAHGHDVGLSQIPHKSGGEPR